MVVKGPERDLPTMSLLKMLEQAVQEHGNRAAIVFAGQTMTYDQLYRAVKQCMTALQADGVGLGDRVGLMLPNCPQYVIAYYAITGLGAIVVQLNPMYTVRELTHLLTDAKCHTIIVYDKLLPVITGATASSSFAPQNLIAVRLDAGVENLPNGTHLFDVWMKQDAAPKLVPTFDVKETVAALQYTGGTTGLPKGAMLTHYNIVSNAYQNLHGPGPLPDTPDVVLCALPLFHVYAMTSCMNSSILGGNTIVMMPRFDPQEALRLIEAYQVTLFPAVPTMYVAVSQVAKSNPSAFQSLRLCGSGGASMPIQVMTAFEKLTGALVLEGFGLSETSPVTHINQENRRRVGSVGIPLCNTECKIVSLDDGVTQLPAGEIGELAIRGPQVMKGYWNRPEETAAALRGGWFFTGDIARIDEEGFTYIVDRKKDMIIASGYNIYPRDVEEVLYEHPAVLEAAVIGVPDEYRGESVKAYVVLKAGLEATEKDIMDWCRERLAAYKIPRLIEFRSELPKSGVGKILRRALKTPAS